MYAEWVEILHGCHGEAMVVGISYHLKLNLFPSFERLFNENLWCEGEGAASEFPKGLLVWADTRTESSKCVGRAYHHRESDAVGSAQCVVHGFHCLAHRGFEFFLVQFLHEEVAVFCVHDGLYGCAKHSHSILFKHTAEI